MPSWTTEQVAAFAPDSASFSAGQGLASVKKWSGLGRNERAIWGLCQGSAKSPYEARMDLVDPAFKCNCPSRKFPCKHGLALLLLFVNTPGAFKEQAEPGWVADWLAGRSERAEKKAEKAKAAPEQPVDAEAQAKRAAQRASRVEDGIAGCRVWLEDLVRRGLAAAQSEPAAQFERVAARMVDAQAPGLAALVRRVPELIGSGPGWEVRTLDHLGRLHLLLRAGEQLKDLPADLALDVRTTLGWNHAKEEVLAGAAVQDCWVSVGHLIEEDDRLTTRRTWLVGRRSGRRALLLDFAAGNAPLPQSTVPGTQFEGEIVFYPSRVPMRALVKSVSETRLVDGDLESVADPTLERALGGYAEGLALNPWIARWPMLIRTCRLAQSGDRWVLVDSDDTALPLRPSFQGSLTMWRMMAASGGKPMTVLAEWDGETTLPVGGIQGSRHVDLASRWAA